MHSGNSSTINSHRVGALSTSRADDEIISPLATTNYRMLREIRRQVLPVKLNAILSNPEFSHIITWMPHGRAWRILSPHEFAEKVLPLYVEQPNYNSFIRLVNAWGFHRITSGSDTNAYFHKLFLRGKPHLHQMMKRLGRNAKKPRLDQRDEPDFYSMAPLTDDVSPCVTGSSQHEVGHLANASIQGEQRASRNFRPQDLLENHMTIPLSSTGHQTLSAPFNSLPSMDRNFSSVDEIALANLLNPLTHGANGIHRAGADLLNASGDTSALIAALNNVVSAPGAGIGTASNPSARTMFSNMTNLHPSVTAATPISMSTNGIMNGNVSREQSIIESLLADARRGNGIDISTLSNEHRRQIDMANLISSQPPNLLPQPDNMGGWMNNDIVSRIIAQSAAARPPVSLPPATNQMPLDPKTVLLLQQYSALQSTGRSTGNRTDTDAAVNQLVQQLKLQQEQKEFEETMRKTTPHGYGDRARSSSVGSGPGASSVNELFLRQINSQLVNYEDQHNRMQQNVLSLQEQNTSLISDRLNNLSEYQRIIALNNHLLEQNIKKLQSATNKPSPSPARSKMPDSSSFMNSIKSASIQPPVELTAPAVVSSQTQVPGLVESQVIQQRRKKSHQRMEEVRSGTLDNMNVQEILLSLKRQRK